MLPESGFTRSQNSINVAMNNMTDLGLSVLLYGMSGFGMDIIKQSIHELGGKIRTSFSRGKFTEFSILIPLRSDV